MRKILILLTIIYSFSFSFDYTGVSSVNPSDGKTYYLGNSPFPICDSYTVPNWTLASNGGCPTMGVWFNDDRSYFSSKSGTCPNGSVTISSCYVTPNTLTTVPPPPPTPTVNVLSSSQTEHGSTIVDYDDGAKMIIFPDLTAFTFDVNGNLVPNYAFNGTTPPASTPFTDDNAFVSNTNKKYFDITFNGFPILVVDKDSAGFHSMAITPLNALQTLAMIAVTPKTVSKNGEDIKIISSPTSSNPNAAKVDITTIKFDNVDFSEYESTATNVPTPIPNSNLVVEKIDSTNQNKFPAIRSGTVVTHDNIDFSQFIATTPTSVAVGSQNQQGVVSQTVFSKADLITSTTTGSVLNSFQEVLQPIKQNVDGTSSQTVASTPISTTGGSSSVGVSTTQTTVSSPSSAGSGSTSSTFSSGSGTIDLSGVTSRLDRISSQLTYSNNKFDQLTSEPVGTSNLNTKISEYSSKLSDLSLSADNALDFVNGFQNDITNLKQQFDDAKAIFDDKPLINLASSSTCSINAVIFGRSFDADLCSFISPYRTYLSLFFTLFMTFAVFMFALKYLFNFNLGGK